MVNNLAEEFRVIRLAFKRVKKDNLYLLKRIDELEKKNEELKTLVLKGLDDVKVVVSEDAGAELSKVDVDENFVGSLRTKIVHVPSCRFAKRLSVKNKVVFENLEDAKEKEFSFCKCVQKN